MFIKNEKGLILIERFLKFLKLLLTKSNLVNSQFKKAAVNPAQNLFIWAVLLNRIDIAKIFWQFGKYQMANALYCSILLKNMSTSLPQSSDLLYQAKYEY